MQTQETQTYQELYRELCKRIKLNCGVENEILDLLKGIREDRQKMETELARLDFEMDSISHLDY